MASGKGIQVIWCGCAAAGIGLAAGRLFAEDAPVTQQQLNELRDQNLRLQEQLQRQQTMIDGLMHQVKDLQESTPERGRTAEPSPANEPAPKLPNFNLG